MLCISFRRLMVWSAYPIWLYSTLSLFMRCRHLQNRKINEIGLTLNRVSTALDANKNRTLGVAEGQKRHKGSWNREQPDRVSKGKVKHDEFKAYQSAN